MKSWSFRKKIFVSLICLFAVYVGFSCYRNLKFKDRYENGSAHLSKNEILHLEISGVIMNGKKFLNQLKKYQKDETIKAIVIDINSPGGAVGPSQEIFSEIMRAKAETKKPVVCVTTGLMASGGYYSALACDKIVTAPGSMVGSIGVIMEFANLEKLYDWAKVSRYTITSGKFKDSGSEYRPMREDEKQLFQDMINEVYAQFRDQVAESRKLAKEFVNQYADGRVMTGATAVKLKFADQVGTFEDAVRLAAELAKIDKDYKVFKPQKPKLSFFDLISMSDDDEDDLNSLADLKLALTAKNSRSVVKELAQTMMHSQFLNQPLYLMPGYWE